jgi:hypothetical protein
MRHSLTSAFAVRLTASLKILAVGLLVLFWASQALSQHSAGILQQDSGPVGEGWLGFTDIGFMVDALLTLALAAVLGAIFAHHPRHARTADTLEEIEAPRILVVYAVIGAIIGILVVKYGLVVGFVLFGIGGLIRFRTVLGSAGMTGRVIFVTLIGLSCGLNLPHVAVLVTAFGFVLIYILDARITYRIVVQTLAEEHIPASAAAYRAVLEQQQCRILSEKKTPLKGKVAFIFQCPGHARRDEIEAAIDAQIDDPLKGAIDWEID